MPRNANSVCLLRKYFCLRVGLREAIKIINIVADFHREGQVFDEQQNQDWE
jgi:hypothetical protein